MIHPLTSLISGIKSLHLKFSFESSNDGTKKIVKNKGTTHTDNRQAVQITNNYNGPIIQINAPINDDIRKELKPIIDAYENKQAVFIADEPKKVLSDVTLHEQDSMVRGLLRFFRPKLSTRDYQLMRTGLYLKYLRDNDRTVEANRLWKQISENNGPREKTLINLASAGYFHTYFRPLYKQLLKTENAQRKFNKEFEKILDDVTFAIFVHVQMPAEDVVKKVKQKAIKNIRYGVKVETISLHATGNTCVGTVQEAVRLLRPIFPSIKVKSEPGGLVIVTATIDYRTNTLTDEELHSKQ
jgi:hypothetical protein